MLDECLEPLCQMIGKTYLDFLYDSYNQPENTFNKRRDRKIRLKYLNNNRLDAWSDYDYENDCDVIGVERNLIMVFYKFAELMVSEEKYPFEDRQLLIFHLFATALRFVIGHEFFHLYAGHCDYLRTKEGACTKLGVAYDAATHLPMTDFQTLEMNADCCAACRLVDVTVSPDYSNPFIPKPVGELLDSEPNGRIKYLAHAIDLIFFVFRYADNMTVTPYYDEEDHPPLFMRQIMNLNTLKKYLFIEYHMDFSDSFFDECLADDEKCLVSHTKLLPNINYYKGSLNEELIQHESLLRKNWLKMKDVLAPFSRIAPAILIDS